jgi:hypothetical protein
MADPTAAVGARGGDVLILTLAGQTVDVRDALFRTVNCTHARISIDYCSGISSPGRTCKTDSDRPTRLIWPNGASRLEL